METSAGGVTVSVVAPVTEFSVAEMVTLPANKAFASPAELIVATLAAEEFQLTVLVKFCVLPSV
jgi:hypothetical protein